MEERFTQDDERWEQVNLNFDLLFARVDSMGANQQRMEAQMDLGNKVMEQILHDQQLLAKQIELTGEAVARLNLNQTPLPEHDVEPPSPTYTHRSGPSFRTNRPPPLGNPSRIRPPAPRTHRSPESPAGYRHVLPKMSCPTFDGSNPRIWKSKCLDYFALCNIDEAFWTIAASLSMDGNAAKWLQVYKKKHGLGSWTSFMAAVEQKFGVNAYRDAMEELLELRQTATVEDYALAFENLQFEISMHNDGFDDTFFVSQFVRGLRSDIATGVQAHIPKIVDEAILLAKRQQQVLDKGKQSWSKPVSHHKSQSVSQKADSKSAGPQSSLWKERQTLNYRKANNLCYYCGDKYDPSHVAVCKQRPQAQVHALVANDLDMPLSEEVVAQLELEDSLSAEFCQLSLNALAGTDHGDALKLKAKVKNQAMLTLVDSGSTHSFVSSEFLAKVGITPVPTTPKQVKLPNGDILISDCWVPDMAWLCNGYTLHSDMRVLDFSVFDAILGYDWLKPHSPMQCHWSKKNTGFSASRKAGSFAGLTATTPFSPGLLC